MTSLACPVTDEKHSPGRLYQGMCSKHFSRVKKYGTPHPVHALVCRSCNEGFQAGTRSRQYCDTCRPVADAGYRIRAIEELAASKKMRCATCSEWMHRSSTSRPEGVAKCSTCRTVHDGSAAKDGCRCDPCLAAKASYMRAYKDAVRAEHGVGPTTIFRRRFRQENGYSYSTHDSIPVANRRAVYERDGWVCQICLKPVPRNADASSQLRASIDHIIPRSIQDEPDHSVEALRMAHLICNAMRSDNRMTDEEIRRRDPAATYV